MATTPLTRETFISADYIKIAATQSTMFNATENGEGVEEVPAPASVRETGTIPDGFSVDFVLDPSTVVASLKKQEITTVEQLPVGALEELRDAINSPENLRIIPTSIHLQGVFAAPLDVVLEARGRVKSTPSAKAKKLTAGSLKKSSATYRKAALRSSTFTKSGGKISKTKTPKVAPKGKDADHILEAQTVAKALHRGGHTTTTSLGTKGHQAVKDALNHHSNMAFVDADVNRAKGQAHRSALSGNTPHASGHVKDYMKQTSTAGKDTAKKVDSVLKKHGVSGVSVQKEHQGVLKKMGLKRELSLDELD
ncbi:hypothetical protein M413DRAFT_32450 [Hebeloma cylindrosporum]|uniref:Uncharacterized protein n=1 Tax=Hebeloma cylindrosporum TaxID=76867 RepID=A0A0C3BVS0_HEBCY|nr:hypothetical protein M413DRAFT_32450 [Hebeloma cylindrosporum h7]